MPTIRAYTFTDRIVVKYYDNGNREHLECPNCGWIGKVESSFDQKPLLPDLFCPHCDTMLGSQSFLGATELVEEDSWENGFD